MADPNMSHGAQKPVALYIDLLKRSVKPGDVVFDPFAGSGTIFPAAHQAKVKAIGIEMNPEYAGLCVQRINSLDTDFAAAQAQGNSLMSELQSMGK